MSNAIKWILSIAILSSVIIFSYRYFSNHSSSPPKLSFGDNAPADFFVEANAQDILARVKKTKYTLVNIWATWCEPCREEFPFLIELRKKYLDKGVNFILVSADFASQRSEALNFLKEQHVDFPTFHKNEDDADFINALYPDWTGAIPATLIFNQKGQRLQEWQGGATREQFEAAIQSVLKVENPKGGPHDPHS